MFEHSMQYRKLYEEIEYLTKELSNKNINSKIVKAKNELGNMIIRHPMANS